MHPHPEPCNAPPSKPFLKWCGGKQRLLRQLAPLLPAGGRLLEPFVGAGSVFLGTRYDRYVINDANLDLIALWRALQQSPDDYMKRAAALFCEKNHSPTAYARIRGEFNGRSRSDERAVLLPYLNRFGFNGLYRVNSSGIFNAPYGSPAKLPSFPWDEMQAASAKLAFVQIESGSYLNILALAGAGDVVYCDPPYLESTRGKSFTGYTPAGFALRDHIELVAAARMAAARGAHVLISNHDTADSRALYDGCRIEALQVSRTMAARAQARAAARELVAIFAPVG